MHLRPHRNKKTLGVYLSMTGPSKANILEVDEVLAQGGEAQNSFLHDRFQNLDWQSKRVLDGLDASDDLYLQNVAMVITPQWTSGRCAIVGDSAFAMLGTGTSFAIVGAYIIAGELSEISSNTSADVSAALQSYEHILRPLIAKHEKPPPFFPHMVNPQTQLGLTTLRTMVRLAFGLGVPQLLQKFFGGEEKESWKLPDYGWQQSQPVRAE